MALLRYELLIEEGLELGTGAVEGAVKNIIAKRCDHGGMRWIKERVEAVVQLLCIEANGDFDRFSAFVHQRRSRTRPGGHPTATAQRARTLPDLRGGGVTWADLHP